MYFPLRIVFLIQIQFSKSQFQFFEIHFHFIENQIQINDDFQKENVQCFEGKRFEVQKGQFDSSEELYWNEEKFKFVDILSVFVIKKMMYECCSLWCWSIWFNWKPNVNSREWVFNEAHPTQSVAIDWALEHENRLLVFFCAPNPTDCLLRSDWDCSFFTTYESCDCNWVAAVLNVRN